jgi:hypothetical protein
VKNKGGRQYVSGSFSAYAPAGHFGYRSDYIWTGQARRAWELVRQSDQGLPESTSGTGKETGGIFSEKKYVKKALHNR